MNTQPEIEKLRALAEAATPGPWSVEQGEFHDVRGAEPHAPLCWGEDYDDYGGASPADLAYIAAVSPDVVLRLLAVVEAAEALRELSDSHGHDRDYAEIALDNAVDVFRGAISPEAPKS